MRNRINERLWDNPKYKEESIKRRTFSKYVKLEKERSAVPSKQFRRPEKTSSALQLFNNKTAVPYVLQLMVFYPKKLKDER